MKKTVIASSLAVSLGIAGYALSGNEAHASEATNVDQAHLVDLAQNHPDQLNAKPVQAGSYDIHFVNNGFEYNFTSNGTNWSWSYQQAGSQSSSADYTQSYNQESSNQSVSSNTQSSNTNVEAVSAPTTSHHSYNTSTTDYSSYGSSVTLSNGNNAGSVGSYAAAQMAARTGVSASTWEYIIARESNGQSGARNASGASGLFQTMPGWGSTASVNDQINAAYKAYKAQGLSAWGM
ncbi:transglycosylase SLT domain-containing protein [Staphylococcus caprae]|uniref:transglycosylase SLT domain-containing protein n=1 Tax=Staphylococcus caprae TaxID=29380 RepID=UPI000E67CF11|nr:transglycosylase SLT domain-containing protein [Staphylococcus caprae]MDK6298770.1 transglycosylase [Staphylococcus caprae]MDK7232228.1 transglycosylase [Staphylococcus caprae]RIM33776.1 transglycosylase [Staphylococcus caprae]